MRGSLAQPVHLTAIVASFGLLALLLTAIGVFGVIAFDVAQRTREIGIRMALGAQKADVVRELLKQAGVISVIGIVIGLPAAIGAVRLLRGSFFGVPLQEPASLALAVFLLFGAISLASFLPGLRATRIDPMRALRHE